jgi:hypothetical protein
MFFYAHFNKSKVEVRSNKSAQFKGGATFEKDRFSQDSTSLYVDGQNDYVDFGNNLNMKSIDSFSVSFWIQPEDVNYAKSGGPSNGVYPIIGNAKSNTGFTIYQKGDELHFTLSEGTGNDKCYYVLRQADNNNWLHVTGVSKKGVLKLYVNANLIKSVAAPSKRNLSSENLEMGRDVSNGSVFWEGRIDEVRMYNGALSKKQIRTIYTQEKKGVCFTPLSDTVKVFDTTKKEIVETVVVKNTIQDTSLIIDTVKTPVYVIDTNLVYHFDTMTFYDTLKATLYDTVLNVEFDTFRIRTYDTLTIVNYDTVLTRYLTVDSISVDDTLNFSIKTKLLNSPVRSFRIYTNSTGSIIYVEVDNHLGLSEYNMSITNHKGKTMWTQFVTAQTFTINTMDLKDIGLFNFNVYDEPDNLIKRKALVINQ